MRFYNHSRLSCTIVVVIVEGRCWGNGIYLHNKTKLNGMQQITLVYVDIVNNNNITLIL